MFYPAIPSHAPITHARRCPRISAGFHLKYTHGVKGGSNVTTETKTKPQVAIMNAVHDLPGLVARDRGFYKDQSLDLEFVTTPGMAQVTTSQSVKSASRSSRHRALAPNEVS